MARGLRRLVRSIVTRFKSPQSISKAALRRPLDFMPLEERIVLSLASLPNEFLPPGTVPLSLNLTNLNLDNRPDLVVLGTDGQLTVALNRGDDFWQNLTTTSLGIPAPVGMGLGPVDRDPFNDLVVQTSDGIVFASGDGFGRFRSFQTLGLGTPGSFASPNGRAINPIVAPLAGDPFPDIVAVAPGSNEVAILRTSESGFAPVVRYATGGLTPVAVASGQFIGDAIPDLAIGHSMVL